jgi:hypothetical protein
MKKISNWKRWCTVFVSLVLALMNCSEVLGYAFNLVVPDVRQPPSISGGSACPARAHQLTGTGNIAVRWSTTLGSNPITIHTQTQDPATQLTEIEQTITESLAVWTGVSGTTFTPASLSPLTRISSAVVAT